MTHPSTAARSAPLQRALALAGIVLLTTALLTLISSPAHADTTSSVSGSGCGQRQGVTVVVDFTDLGGGIEVGCAEGDPASGREALEAAGFSPKDSSPGMICTIDAQPDPCPEEFTGSYWSYWHGQDGEWASYEMGADQADPAPGAVEGWRYSDGSTGPGVAPAEAAEATSEAATSETDSADEAAEAADQSDFDPAGLIIALAVGAVLVIAVVLVLRRRHAMRDD